MVGVQLLPLFPCPRRALPPGEKTATENMDLHRSTVFLTPHSTTCQRGKPSFYISNGHTPRLRGCVVGQCHRQGDGRTRWDDHSPQCSTQNRIKTSVGIGTLTGHDPPACENNSAEHERTHCAHPGEKR